LRGSAGGMGQRRRHRDATGRRWRSAGCARTTPVSADRTDQRGGGHTKGCLEKLKARRSLPWLWTGHGRNGGHGTGGGLRWAVAEVLGSRGQSEREGERAGQGALIEEGRWASRARGLGRGRRTRGRGRVHGGEIVGGRLGTRRQVGSVGQREGNQAWARTMAPIGWSHGAARERGREGARVCADRRGPPIRLRDAQARARARGLGLMGCLGPNWFSYFPRISMAFSIYFL
jgi:hypothetical protein